MKTAFRDAGRDNELGNAIIAEDDTFIHFKNYSIAREFLTLNPELLYSIVLPLLETTNATLINISPQNPLVMNYDDLLID